MSIKNSIEKAVTSIHNLEIDAYRSGEFDYKDDVRLSKRKHIAAKSKRTEEENLVTGDLELRFNKRARRIIKSELYDCKRKCEEMGIEMPFFSDMHILVIRNIFNSEPKTCTQFWQDVWRLAHWIRSASEMPSLLEQLNKLLVGGNCLSCYNALSSSTDFFKWSPGALMRHINSIIWRANQILEPSRVRVSWAGVSLALKMGNRKRGKAAVIAAAGTFLGANYCNYGAKQRPYSYFRDSLAQYLCSSRTEILSDRLKLKSKVAHVLNFQVFEAVEIHRPYYRQRKTVVIDSDSTYIVSVHEGPATSCESRYYYAYYSRLCSLYSSIEQACSESGIKVPSSLEEEVYQLEVNDLLSTLPKNFCPIMYRSDIAIGDMPGVTQDDIYDFFKFASEHSNIVRKEHEHIGIEQLLRCSGYTMGQISAIGISKFRTEMRGNSDIYN